MHMLTYWYAGEELNFSTSACSLTNGSCDWKVWSSQNYGEKPHLQQLHNLESKDALQSQEDLTKDCNVMLKAFKL